MSPSDFSVQAGKASVTVFFYGSGGLHANVTLDFDEAHALSEALLTAAQDAVLAEAKEGLRAQYEATGSVCVDAERIQP